MDKIIMSISRFVFYFTLVLLFIFLVIDMGIFGDEVKISNFYYIFIGIFILLSYWGLRNHHRFKNF